MNHGFKKIRKHYPKDRIRSFWFKVWGWKEFPTVYLMRACSKALCELNDLIWIMTLSLRYLADWKVNIIGVKYVTAGLLCNGGWVGNQQAWLVIWSSIVTHQKSLSCKNQQKDHLQKPHKERCHLPPKKVVGSGTEQWSLAQDPVVSFPRNHGGGLAKIWDLS